MKFVFWQGVFSMHQSSCLRALAERGHDCVCVVDDLVDALPERVKMGWRHPDPGRVRVVVNPGREAMREIFAGADGETIHVLGGIRSTRTVEFAWMHCLNHPRRFGIISEGADPRGWKGLLRRVFFRWVGARHGDRPDFVLAMGENGVRWWRKSGFRADRVFPFAYTMELAPREADHAPREDLRYRIAYVASLCRRKAPDTLLRAVARLPGCDWRLQLIGDGPMRGLLEAGVRKAGRTGQVEFLGFLPHEAAMSVLAASDVLVLPSRFDGWGAVVNEALMRGVPVVCSDRCAARDLVSEAWRGEVYPYRDADALARSLATRIATGPPNAAARQRITDWSRRIEGTSLAEYCLAVMKHVYAAAPRPIPPWNC